MMEAATRAVPAKCYLPASEAAELGGAAQRVGHVARGAERVDEAEEQEAAAVDAEHGRPRLVDDRDAGVHERAPAHDDPPAAVALYLVARAEPAAEHGDDLAGRHVLAWHLYLRHGLQGSAICWINAECDLSRPAARAQFKCPASSAEPGSGVGRQ